MPKCKTQHFLETGYHLKAYFSCPIEIIKRLTGKGTVLISHKIKGASKRGCLQHNCFHQDKDQHLISKYLILSWDHFIAPVEKS